MRIKQNNFKTRVDLNGRVCTACNEYLPWESFSTANKSLTRRTSKCKTCKGTSRPSRDTGKEKRDAKVRRKELMGTNPNLVRARNIRTSIMTRSRKIGLDRSDVPTPIEIANWLREQEPLKCYYSGRPVALFKMHIDHKTPLSRHGKNDLSNLCVTDSKINSAKGQMTEKEFKDLLNLMSDWEDGGDYLLSRLRQGFMGKGKFK
jgi:5-methylcytosine-specific restriction endonuclease McrA